LDVVCDERFEAGTRLFLSLSLSGLHCFVPLPVTSCHIISRHNTSYHVTSHRSRMRMIFYLLDERMAEWMDGWKSRFHLFAVSTRIFVVRGDGINPKAGFHPCFHPLECQSINQTKSNQIIKSILQTFWNHRNHVRGSEAFLAFLHYHTIHSQDSTKQPPTHPTIQPPFQTNYTHARTQIILL